jgi:hypothetical protein
MYIRIRVFLGHLAYMLGITANFGANFKCVAYIPRERVNMSPFAKDMCVFLVHTICVCVCICTIHEHMHVCDDITKNTPA